MDISLKPLVALLALKESAQKLSTFLDEDVKDFALKDIVNDEGQVLLAADVVRGPCALISSFIERATASMANYWQSVLKLINLVFKQITPEWQPLAAFPLDESKITKVVLENPYRQLLNVLHSKVAKAMKDYSKASLDNLGFDAVVQTWSADWKQTEAMVGAAKEAAAVASGHVISYLS